MAANKKISEEIKTDIAFVSSAAVAGVTSKLYVAARDALRVQAVVCAHLSSGETLTLQLVQATDSAGTDSKDLGDEVVFTNSSGTNRDVIGRIECHTDALDAANGFLYVGITATTSEATNAAGIFIRTGLYFRDGIAQTHIPAISVTTTAVPTTTDEEAAPTTTGEEAVPTTTGEE
jgi:hypothetical protein